MEHEAMGVLTQIGSKIRNLLGRLGFRKFQPTTLDTKGEVHPNSMLKEEEKSDDQEDVTSDMIDDVDDASNVAIFHIQGEEDNDIVAPYEIDELMDCQ